MMCVLHTLNILLPVYELSACPCTNDTNELHQNSMHSYRDTIVSIDGWWLIMIIIGVLLTHQYVCYIHVQSHSDPGPRLEDLGMRPRDAHRFMLSVYLARMKWIIVVLIYLLQWDLSGIHNIIIIISIASQLYMACNISSDCDHRYLIYYLLVVHACWTIIIQLLSLQLHLISH